MCDECNGEESMPDCKCGGEGWLLRGQAATGEAIKSAFATMHAARKARRCAAIPARFAVIEEVSARVAMALGKDDSRVTELLAMVRDLLPAPASGWQDGKPSPGPWWVSLAPKCRMSPAAVHAVFVCESGDIMAEDGTFFSIGQHWTLEGAKWKRRDVPSDPFLSPITLPSVSVAANPDGYNGQTKVSP